MEKNILTKVEEDLIPSKKLFPVEISQSQRNEIITFIQNI